MNIEVDTIGPFNNGDYYRLVINGYKVPYLVARLRKGTEDLWDIILDDRFAYEMTDRELKNALPLIADAMAIAAGYSSFGEHCLPANPFKIKMIGITTASQE